jgi:hypothetical protein
LQFSNVSLEIAQSPSRWFNHPMRRTGFSTILFVAILGLGCMGVAVPSKADEHCEDIMDPRYDPAECEPDQNSLRNLRSEADYRVCTEATELARPHWRSVLFSPSLCQWEVSDFCMTGSCDLVHAVLG